MFIRATIADRVWQRARRRLLALLLFQAIVLGVFAAIFNQTILWVINAKVFPYVQTMEVTAYTAGAESTGKHRHHPDYGLTASTYRIAVGTGEKCIAAPPEISFGTRIFVPGYGWGVVQDRGEDIVGRNLDVYFDDLVAAQNWGRKTLDVIVLP